MKPPIVFLPGGPGKFGVVPRNRHQYEVVNKIAAGEVVSDAAEDQPCMNSATAEPARPESKPEAKKRQPAADSWTSLRKTLQKWDNLQLLGLLHDLFKTVPDARDAIVGRLLLDQPAAAKEKTLDEMRRRIQRAVRPGRGIDPGTPNLAAARRIGDQYLRATSDADGAILLYMEMIDEALELATDYGWSDSAFYDSIARAAAAAEKQAANAVDGSMLDQLSAELESLLMHANFPGWGMDDVIDSLAQTLRGRAMELAETNALDAPRTPGRSASRRG